MLWLLFSLAGPAWADDGAPIAIEAADDARAAWSAEQWLAAVDERAASIPGMRYSVQRTSERAGTTLQERWRMVQYGSSFRVDYFGDTARQITFDGRVLVDYVPANRAAVRFHVDQMTLEEGGKLVGSVLAKVAVPGFRVGQPDGVSWTVTTDQAWEGRPVVVLEGDGREESHLRYVIDRERVCVLHTVITQAGQAVLDAKSSDHREVKPGVWLPHAVDLRAPEAGGQVRIALHLTKVTVLAEHPGNLFEAGLDASIPVEEQP